MFHRMCIHGTDTNRSCPLMVDLVDVFVKSWMMQVSGIHRTGYQTKVQWDSYGQVACNS